MVSIQYWIIVILEWIECGKNQNNKTSGMFLDGFIFYLLQDSRTASLDGWELQYLQWSIALAQLFGGTFEKH